MIKIVLKYLFLLFIALLIVTDCESFEDTLDKKHLKEILEYCNSKDPKEKIKCLDYFDTIYAKKEDNQSTDEIRKRIARVYIRTGEYQQARHYIDKIHNKQTRKELMMLIKENQVFSDYSRINDYKDALDFYENNRETLSNEKILVSIVNMFLFNKNYEDAALFCRNIKDVELQVKYSQYISKRIEELQKRQQDIDAQIKEIENRLLNVPENLSKILPGAMKTIEKIHYNVYRNRPIITIKEMNRLFNGNPDAFDVLTAFNKALKQRNIDLILIPVPNHLNTYAYKYIKNADSRLEIWPAYLNGMKKLLLNDVEIIEVTDDFREYSEEDLSLLHMQNHHWSSGGMRITAKELAKRLKRYSWLEINKRDESDFVEDIIWVNTTPMLEKKIMETMIQITDTQYTDIGNRIDPILIMGDSNVNWKGRYPQGCGFINHITKELGVPVPYRARGAGNINAAYTYSRNYSSIYPQPKVIMLVIWQESLGWDGWKMPVLPLPEPEMKADDKTEKKENIIVAGKVIFASTPPDPAAAAYPDALTVTEYETEYHGDRKVIQGIQWVMKDQKLLDTAKIKRGDYYWLELSPWDDIVKTNTKLSEIMVIDDTESFDLEQFWIIRSEKAVKTTIPVAPADDSYVQQHEENKQKILDESVDILLLGDSIIHGWDREVWNSHFKDVQMVNWGIEGDRIEQLIWRIDNGELEKSRIKSIIIQAGTNNIAEDSPEDIYTGIRTIIKIIQNRLPGMPFLIIGLLPCEINGNRYHEKIIKVNTLLEGIKDDITFFYVDIYDNYLNYDNTINTVLLPDHLHLSEDGYEVLAQSIEGVISKSLLIH